MIQFYSECRVIPQVITSHWCNSTVSHLELLFILIGGDGRATGRETKKVFNYVLWYFVDFLAKKKPLEIAARGSGELGICSLNQQENILHWLVKGAESRCHSSRRWHSSNRRLPAWESGEHPLAWLLRLVLRAGSVFRVRLSVSKGRVRWGSLQEKQLSGSMGLMNRKNPHYSH